MARRRGNRGNRAGGRGIMRVPRGGHRFSEVPRAQIQRSQFDRSYGLKTTFDAGFLVPILVDEVLPGDTYNVRMTGFARMATPLKPIMDNMYMETFFFFVPYRLVWTNWTRFNGEQQNPEASTDFVIPRIANDATIQEHSLADYMGIPLGLETTSNHISALPFRAYRLIWNEWFRDQNLQNSSTVPTGDGPDTTSLATGNLRRRGKRHDYFTSALPWPQKGQSVEIPIADNADVATNTPPGDRITIALGGSVYREMGANTDAVTMSNAGGVDPHLRRMWVDLESATSTTINTLRQAFQVQRLLERDARGGTRYTEIIRSHFGVTSPDQRLQRPEYLGGGSTPVTISPVANTSGTATEDLGDLAAFGTASLNGHGFTSSFTEHGVIIGLVNVRADLTYQQGLDRMWSRKTRFDFYWPALSHIGEQAIMNKEIYVQNSSEDNEVFGYQERYAEYRYKPSIVTGLFRSEADGSLDIWHLAQDFGQLPALNDTFIRDDPPVARVVAVPSEPHFIFDSYVRMKCARPMPVYGVPGLIDHF